MQAYPREVREEAVRLYIEEELDSKEVGRLMRIPHQTIWRWCKKAGVNRSRSEVRRGVNQGPFSDEARERMSKAHIGNKHSKETRRKISLAQRGEKHPNWKGGKTKDGQGYVQISAGPDKGKKEHRLLAEEFLGRELDLAENIHHVNGVRDDNTFPCEEFRNLPLEEKEELLREGIGNLRLMSHGGHSRLHRMEEFR